MPLDLRESGFNPHTSSLGLSGAEPTRLPLNALTSNPKRNCNARAGEAPPCDGEDILGQLNHVFGYSYWKMYQYAREHNKFGAIKNAPGNYKALIEAYEYAGLEVTPRWAAYLRVLGTISSPDPEQGPQNIYDIAQYRDRNLKSNLGMRTTIHEPHDGGHVHVLPGTGIDPEVVDSPFPLPE